MELRCWKWIDFLGVKSNDGPRYAYIFLQLQNMYIYINIYVCMHISPLYILYTVNQKPKTYHMYIYEPHKSWQWVIGDLNITFNSRTIILGPANIQRQWQVAWRHNRLSYLAMANVLQSYSQNTPGQPTQGRVPARQRVGNEGNWKQKNNNSWTIVRLHHLWVSLSQVLLTMSRN